MMVYASNTHNHIFPSILCRLHYVRLYSNSLTHHQTTSRQSKTTHLKIGMDQVDHLGTHVTTTRRTRRLKTGSSSSFYVHAAVALL